MRRQWCGELEVGALRVDLLGPMQVESGGTELVVRGPIRRSLLALLAIRANQVVSVDRLADSLWEGAPPRAASGTIRTYVSQLRTHLGDDAGRLTTERGGYRLALDDDELDCRRFERACRALVIEGSPHGEVAQHLGSALEMWRGSALDEFRGNPWADVEATRLEELRVATMARWASAQIALGQFEAVARVLGAARVEHPYREDLRRHLIVALYSTGRQVDALNEYGDLRRRLADDLGLEPTAQMRALEAAILRHDLVLSGPPTGGRVTASSARVVTFLVTDLVDSTGLWAHDEVAAVRLIRAHFDAVEKVVTANEGTPFKTMGDSTWAVFDRPGDAATAALEILRTGTDDRPPVRIAIDAGEAHAVGDDWFGRTVNRSAQLSSLTHAEQVLVGSTAALLLRDELPPGCHLVDRGPVALPGAADPEHVHELVPALPSSALGRARRDTPAERDFPEPLDAALGGPVIGRERVLAQLRQLSRRPEHAHLALVVGEPGIGKTTLAAVLARELHDEGALVAFGRCREEVAVPHEPLLGALGPVLATGSPDDRRAVEALRHLASTGSAVAADAVVARAYDAMSRTVAVASEANDIVLVLDDLQWANHQTWALMRHLVRNHPADGGRLLVLGTARDTDRSGGDPVAGIVAGLPARSQATMVPLDGLDAADVARLAAIIRGGGVGVDEPATAPTTFGTSLRAATGGNPFLVGQVIAGAGVTSASDAVRWRLDQLSATAQAVLAVAAVAGQSFRVQLVERAHGADVLDALDEAVAARLVREQPSQPGGYELIHGLVRDALLDGLSSARRARLHHRVAEAMLAIDLPWTIDEVERWCRDPLAWTSATTTLKILPNDHATVALLAHHYLEAVDDGATRAALLVGNLSARLSLDANDPLAAVAATDACFPLVSAQPAVERSRLLLQLLLARWSAAQLTGTAREAAELLDELTEVARTSGEPELLAQAVVTTTGLATVPDAPRGMALCREALAAVGPDDRPSRALLLGMLALNQSLTGDAQNAFDIAEEAVRVARRVDDPRALVPNLLILGSVVGLGPDTLSTRREIADELLARADVLADPELRISGVRLAIVAAVEAADADEIERCLLQTARACADGAVQLLPDALHAMWRGMLAHARGDFDEAEAAAGRITEMSGHDGNLAASAQALLFAIARDRGHGPELLPLLRDLSARASSLLFIDVAHATVALDAGHESEAAEIVARLTADGIDALPLDPTWGAAIAMLADVARSVGSDDVRADLIGALRTLSGVLVVNSWGVLCHGAADRHLGGLLVDAGDLDTGIDLLERGVELEDRINARALSARSRVALADALCRRDGIDDRHRATSIARIAFDDARRIGMPAVAAEALVFADPTRPT